MKLKEFLIVAPVIMLAASCSDDGPRNNAPTEDYVRAFVKEFGVPAKGHDFSMARSAGLKVKASRPTHITITAEIDGDEYLFGNLNVHEGYTSVPVTIPSEITMLNLYSGGLKYTVSADGIADLDKLTEEMPASRYIHIDATYREGRENGVGWVWDTGKV